MALRSISPKVEVLEIDGSQIHALRPTKAVWDEYVGAMFERDKEGELVVRSYRALTHLYRSCIKKITNVIIDRGEGPLAVAEITDPEEIVKFMAGLNDIEAGRKIDEWLLTLGELDKSEVKN